MHSLHDVSAHCDRHGVFSIMMINSLESEISQSPFVEHYEY